MIWAMLAAIVMVFSTILLHYEVLRFTSTHIAELRMPPRTRILAVVCAAFAAHTGAVWLYACAYWVLVVHLGLGSLSGATAGGFQDCLYIFPPSRTRRSAWATSSRHLMRV